MSRNGSSNLRQTRKPGGLRFRARRLAGAGAMLLALTARLAGAQAHDGLQLREADGIWRPGAALETQVHYRIDGLIAHGTVRQRFINDSTQWMEGRYLLPLPESASVGGLRIEIGERVIEGEVQEKEQARATYEAAAAGGQHAALVEQNRPHLFRAAVTNIAPGESVVVQVDFWQGVRFEEGRFSVAMPLTMVPPWGNDVAAPPARAGDAAVAATQADRALAPVASLSVDLGPGVPLQAVESPTHRIALRRDGDRYHVDLADLAVQADRTFELRWHPVAGTTPQSAVFVEQIGTEHFAYAMLVPPAQQALALPRELVLVIDTSGSMHGTALEQARAALVEALAHLRPQDRFNLIEFNSQANALFARSRQVTPEAVDEAVRWLAALRAEGGTRMDAAFHLALRDPPAPGFVRQVVFATDAGIGNEETLFAQIARDLGQARLFPVGIGSAPNAWFLRRAAQIGRGSHVTIRALDEVQARMADLFQRLDRPALTDVSVQWPEGAEATRGLLPDLYHGEPLIAIARLPDVRGEVRIQGQGVGGAWRTSLPLSEARPADGVGRLFARDAIESLEDAMRRGTPEAQVRPRIVELATRHGLASRYTSLVAVEHTPARPEGAVLVSTRFENAAPGQDDALVFAQGASNARGLMAWAGVLALLALLFGRPGGVREEA